MVDRVDDVQAQKLKALREKFPIDALKLENTAGMNWRNRMQASHAYFRRYSRKWRENLKLYSDFDAMIEQYGTYVAMPFASVQNWVNDTYYRNPDPLVQDKGGDKDKGKVLSDLFRTVHHEVDSERKFKEALLDQAWAGFGLLWASFRQQGYVDPEAFDYDRNAQGAVVPTKQGCTLTRISPWRVRFDPNGREWDMTDHNWVAILYEQSLGQLMRDPTVTDEDRRRLMAWYAAGSSRYYDPAVELNAETTAFNEDDPEYIRVSLWQIWARPDKMTYRLPHGAMFTLSPQPWNPEFADADEFPCHYMAKNREPENEQRTTGFIGIPDITLIEPHVKNINKLEALFMAANQHVINKYVTVKGALDQTAQQKLADGTRQFAVIELDKDALNNFTSAFPAGRELNIKDVLTLVPQAELKELHHLEGIQNEMNFIQQIIGQGPADRGGVQKSGSATESLGMQQGLSRRMSNARHENGKHFCRVTRKFFIILKARQTLPLRYQMVAPFGQKVWQELSANALVDLDLHFEYAVGSSEYRTREQEFALRQQMAQVLLPIFQAQNNTRLIMKVAQDLVEPLNVIGSEQYFNDEAQATAMQLLAIMRGLGKGSVLADDPQAAKQIVELVAQLAQAILTPQQLAEVEAASAGAPAPQPEGEGSLPSAPSAGQQAAAAGSAMAGQMGGMQSSEATN